MDSDKVKIVDIVTGREFKTYPNELMAAVALERERKDFYRQSGYRNAWFTQAIVPATAEWRFNPQTELWEWS